MASCILLLGFFSAFGSGCDSSSNFTFDGSSIHGPLSVQSIPGSDFALVVSTNFDFSNSATDPEEDGGIIHVLNLVTQKLDTASAVQIPNFCGDLRVDAAKSRIFLADRSNDQILVFSYTIPGSGGKAIDFKPVKTIKVGKNPFALALASPTDTAYDKIYSANLEEGDLSLIRADTLKVVDLDPQDDDKQTLPLNELAIGSANFNGQLVRPNRFLNFGKDDLLLLSTSVSGLLYLMDAKNNAIEAVINLTPLVSQPSLHGMAITSAQQFFIASHGAEAILELDFSSIDDNGIDNESIIPPLVSTIPTLGKVEALQLSTDETKLYAANYSRNSVQVYSTINGSLLTEIPVGQGPAELTLNNSGSQLLVTHFLGDSLAIIDTATDTLLKTVP